MFSIDLNACPIKRNPIKYKGLLGGLYTFKGLLLKTKTESFILQRDTDNVFTAFFFRWFQRWSNYVWKFSVVTARKDATEDILSELENKIFLKLFSSELFSTLTPTLFPQFWQREWCPGFHHWGGAPTCSQPQKKCQYIAKTNRLGKIDLAMNYLRKGSLINTGKKNSGEVWI